jgi:hypothetical protein
MGWQLSFSLDGLHFLLVEDVLLGEVFVVTGALGINTRFLLKTIVSGDARYSFRTFTHFISIIPIAVILHANMNLRSHAHFAFHILVFMLEFLVYGGLGFYLLD